MMGDLLKEIGVDVPLYTANGWEPFKLKNGSRKEYWTAFDTREITENIINAHNEYQPDKPLYNAEFWDGGLQQWGGYFQRISSDDGFYSDVVLVEADKVLGSIDWSSYPMMVNGVSEQLNEDGETVKVVSLGGTTSDYISDKGIRIFEFSDDFEVISGEPYPVDYPGKNVLTKMI